MARFLKIGLLVITLVLIRAFAESLFYDPFITYFKRFLSDSSLPIFDAVKLIAHVFLRFLLNASVSIALLYVVFQSKSILKFTVFFYGVSLMILLIAFVVFLLNLSENNIMVFFYIRRFLIHPIFLLLLLPAFYYQRLMKK